MEKVYNEIIDFVLDSGKRIVKKSGNIQDIGITKKDLTEEDLRIERGLEKIIKKYNPDHELFAEEEHDSFPDAENVWVADPISGTRLFISGKPHYAIAVAYMHNDIVQFSVVHDPATGDLFTAYKDGGAFLNGDLIHVSDSCDDRKMRVVFKRAPNWASGSKEKSVLDHIEKHEICQIDCSFALVYCYVACGRYDGVIALTRDVFPEISGGFMIREAGGIFTNEKGESILNCDDRIFIGGNKKSYEDLKSSIT